jgi:hypothetical protein
MARTLVTERARMAVVEDFYQYQFGDLFTPGAGNVVFEPAFALPSIQLIGSGIYAGPAPGVVRPYFRSTNPQFISAVQAATVAGIGGPIAGQFVTQPLSVPEAGNGSQ